MSFSYYTLVIDISDINIDITDNHPAATHKNTFDYYNVNEQLISFLGVEQQNNLIKYISEVQEGRHPSVNENEADEVFPPNFTPIRSLYIRYSYPSGASSTTKTKIDNYVLSLFSVKTETEDWTYQTYGQNKHINVYINNVLKYEYVEGEATE